MFLRKLGKRGAEMVEYAIVLACIAAVGVGFYSSNDSKLTGVLDSLFGNVRQVLGLETATTDFNGRFKLDSDDQKYAVDVDVDNKLIPNSKKAIAFFELGINLLSTSTSTAYF